MQDKRPGLYEASRIARATALLAGNGYLAARFLELTRSMIRDDLGGATGAFLLMCLSLGGLWFAYGMLRHLDAGDRTMMARFRADESISFGLFVTPVALWLIGTANIVFPTDPPPIVIDESKVVGPR